MSTIALQESITTSRFVATLAGVSAVVTGASCGIGRAIAVELSRQGASVIFGGRDNGRLAAAVREGGELASAFEGDLTDGTGMQRLVEYATERFEVLDVLVHCAGIVCHDRMCDAPVFDLDRQYTHNLRVPYVLTKELLPALRRAKGQIVFVNSSLGLAAKRPEVGQYAAMEHALKAVADSLREEVNGQGIRVLSVYVGRTATPRQERIHAQEGKPYHPQLLLQPEDVAHIVCSCLSLPRTAEVTDLQIRPMQKT